MAGNFLVINSLPTQNHIEPIIYNNINLDQNRNSRTIHHKKPFSGIYAKVGAILLIKIAASVGFLLLGLADLYAQEATTAAGGEASGSGGTVSYSVGQAIYTSVTGSNGSVGSGVQQSYKISSVLGAQLTYVEPVYIDLALAVYPNPTSNYLTLTVSDIEPALRTDISAWNFQLYDMQGILLERSQVTKRKTIIKMEGLPETTYFLKVSDDQTTLKTFKIVKKYKL